VDYIDIVMKAVLRAGLVVGTLDILAAFLHYYLKTQGNPVLVLYYIASGVFGDEAYTGGIQMAFWGLLLHFIIAFTFTILFFLLFRASPLIRRIGIFSGMLYGVFMWSATQFIVIPLSNISSIAPLNLYNVAIAIAILIVCVGVPLYYMAKKSFPKDL
jgi:hypothetical protein